MQPRNLYPVDCNLFEGSHWVLSLCIPPRPGGLQPMLAKCEGYGTRFSCLVTYTDCPNTRVWKCRDVRITRLAPLSPTRCPCPRAGKVWLRDVRASSPGECVAARGCWSGHLVQEQLSRAGAQLARESLAVPGKQHGEGSHGINSNFLQKNGGVVRLAMASGFPWHGPLG